MNDKLVNVYLKQSNPKFYNLISKTGDNTEVHKLIFKNKKTLKGVSKAVVKNEITHQDYEQVHTDNIPVKRFVTSIRSFDHKVVTYKTENCSHFVL